MVKITGNEFCAALTIRQHFAAMAMQGILSTFTGDELEYTFKSIIPQVAVMYADALIAELNKDSDETK